MGRKSRAEVRREEILAAFERCIARYGLDVPLAQIADEAGVQRSLIRHYLGNRDELVAQVIARIAQAYPQRVAVLFDQAVEHGLEAVLDVLFLDPESLHSRVDDPLPEWEAIIAAVIAAAHGQYPQAKQLVAGMMVDILKLAAGVLGRFFPQAAPADCYEVAYGLLCLVHSHESLMPLGMHPLHQDLVRANARSLLRRLGQPG